jgi:hypothetical protein
MKDIVVVKQIIAESITLGDVLKEDVGISLDIDEIQLSCPFHGVDAKKSTRYYRDTDTMYCWVCKKSWDLYGYVSQREALAFNKTVDFIVKKYRIDISKAPDVFSGGETSPMFAKRRVEVDGKALAVEKIKNYLVKLRGKIEDEKYIRLVFAFMLLKHNTPEERFRADSNKLASIIVKLNRG